MKIILNFFERLEDFVTSKIFLNGVGLLGFHSTAWKWNREICFIAWTSCCSRFKSERMVWLPSKKDRRASLSRSQRANVWLKAFSGMVMNEYKLDAEVL